MERHDSSSSSQQPQLPPGFRFHPTDEELVVHYLKKKASSVPLPVTIIAEVDLYKFDPWELPGQATFGDQEWYFFSPRDRKYPNGARPNRAATSGYWKATGTDKPILTSGGTQKIGVKKALVFYGGRPPKGIKTNWIMHEYRLTDNNSIMKPPGIDIANKKSSLRLDEWVLCRIYKKSNSQRSMDRDKEDSMDEILASLPNSTINEQQNLRSQALKMASYGSLLENEDNFFDELISEDNGIDNNSMTQLGSSSLKSDLSIVPSAIANALSLKRGLPSPYWNEPSGVTSQSAKRFQANHHNSGGGTVGVDGSNSISNLLNQLPQATQFHQQTLLGSLGDGIYRQPYQLSGMNWNT